MFRVVVLTVLATGACVAGVGCGSGGGDAGGGATGATAAAVRVPQRPPTEHVLLGPPDPQAGTQRGVFLRDPRGQVERIAAGGRLVAWSVRTPADLLPAEDANGSTDTPRRLPERSIVVVADERGGAPVTVDLGRRWVRQLRMLRGPRGDAEPQLAVEACADRAARRCAAQLVTLAAATPPLRIAGRATGRTADAAVAGRVDAGRQVIAAAGRGHAGGPGGCAPRLTLARLDGTHRRALPAIRFGDTLYTRCTRFDRAELHGRYVFAWIDGKATGSDADAGEQGTTVVALDTGAGSSARWRAVQAPYRYSDGSTGYELGPAITDTAMYWEETDEDERIASLELVALPRDVLHAPVPGTTPTTADPIAPDDVSACDLAATDDAVYELANVRCSPFDGGSAGGVIHRVVAPAFRPGDD